MTPERIAQIKKRGVAMGFPCITCRPLFQRPEVLRIMDYYEDLLAKRDEWPVQDTHNTKVVRLDGSKGPEMPSGPNMGLPG